MRRVLFVMLAALALSAVRVRAQVIPVYGVLYRPPGVGYEVLRSRHFDLIHQKGTSGRAAELAAVLEDALPQAARILPVRADFRMPVVLNDFTDRGNGYVSPIPFRQEIESVPFFSRVLSPRHASWFDTVGPHELVHAVHADYSAGFGFGGLVRLFAPDMARAMNLWVPPGVSEGIAIWLESRRGDRAGRMNYGYYTMQFRAAFGSGSPWSLAQTLEVPAYSRPTDRYYIGGGYFVDWYLRTFGSDAFRRVTRIHNRFPFLGWGVSLWIATGRFPTDVGRSFRRDATRDERERQAALQTTPVVPLVGETGTLHRRPRWLDDTHVAVFSTGYALTRGLYAVEVGTGALRAIAHEELTNDLQFSVEGNEIYYARFRVDPLAAVRSTADLFSVDRRTGAVRRLTRDARLVGPVPHPDGGVLAIETRGRGGAVVHVRADGSIVPVFADPDLRIVGLHTDPVSGRIAVVANRYGIQAAYELDPSTGTLDPLAGFRTGSVLDASWSPGAEWLVLSADPDATLDVYAVRPSDGRVVRLTRATYGAMEPDVSPDGSRLAYVVYGDARFDLVVEPFDPESAPEVDRSTLAVPEAAPAPDMASPGDAVWSDSVPVPYRAAAYVRPRMLYPTFYFGGEEGTGTDAELGLGAGLALQAADPLLTWTYWGEGVYQKGRMWGEMGMAYAGVAFRPAVRAYSRPELVTALFRRAGGQPDTVRVIREERGARLSVGLPVTLSDNVYRSLLTLGSGLQYERERLYDDDMRPLGSFVDRLTVTGSMGLGLRIQRNLRDIMPNSGLGIGMAAERDLWADGVDERGAVAVTAALYLPWLKAWNVGLNLNAGIVAQTEHAVFDLDTFMPRGYEDFLPYDRVVGRAGAEAVVPLAFVDDGLFILPIYLGAVYAYGFGETLFDRERISSFGGGFGVQMRLFYVVGLDLRFGYARRVDLEDWEPVYR